MRERILITVKTYPTLSAKYAELVCTAGVNEAGQWRRLYPIRFRRLEDLQRYRKFQWIEADIDKSPHDNRPESYRVNEESLSICGEPLPTKNKWSARFSSFFHKVQVFEDLNELIDQAHGNQLSLALFRPTEVEQFVVENDEREWDRSRLARLQQERSQLRLFESEKEVNDQYQVVRKLPYKFSYRFRDCRGKTSKLMIEDWEIGALFWKYISSSYDDEKVAIAKVRDKYYQQFVQSGSVDLHLVLGTTWTYHQMKAPNPFVIVGVVCPPVQERGLLF